MLFHKSEAERLRTGPSAAAYAALQGEFDAAFQARLAAASGLAAARAAGETSRIDAAKASVRDTEAALKSVRTRAAALARDTSVDRTFNDVNYIIPTFILEKVPIGLVGLMMLVIVVAATDSIAAELNSLATATVIDFYKRWMRPEAPDSHFLLVGKAATLFWGLLVCVVAVWAVELGSLIEVVNRFGSYFYGSILGVFILAVGFRRATGTGAFVGLIAGMTAVGLVEWQTGIAFLWLNVVGAVAVVVVGLIVSVLDPGRRAS
jgi:Na+/proline symporter